MFKKTGVSLDCGSKNRDLFIDNLRIFLTALVIAHHAVTPFNAGSWYYSEPFQNSILTFTLFGLFLSTNASYFMGLFFMLAGYFTPGSFERKGAKGFLRDRFCRLGIPLLLYSAFIGPALLYFCQVVIPGKGVSFHQFTVEAFKYGGVETGPLWFVVMLLIFASIYTLLRYVLPPRGHSGVTSNVPKFRSLMIYGALIGFATFVLRIAWPMNEWVSLIKFIHLEPGHFLQYVTLFIFGCVAYRRGWIRNISDALGKKALIASIALINCWGLLMIGGGAMTGKLEPFFGGICWQSLAYNLWENLFAVSLITALLYLFRKYFNTQNKLFRQLSTSAFTVYVIHPVILVAVQYAFRPVPMHIILKCFLVCLVAIPLCFAVAIIWKRLLAAGKEMLTKERNITVQ